ncbi:MAG TPA: ABC transporter permease [Gemmatimonadaceae bacterium]|nr:ABC transporter permease [Gemmatimonadaceae bacterium]
MRARLRDVLWRLGGLVTRSHVEQRLDDEMRFHLDMLAERHIASGVAPDEARRRALVEFGGTERFKDEAREEYRSRFVDELVQDVRYATRVLRNHPGYTLAAAVTFALGIGASTAIYSVVNAVLLRSLPYAEPDRLVVLWERHDGRGRERNVVSVPNFEAWRERTRSFEAMAGVVPYPATIAGSPNAERVMGAEVSPGYFRMLGVAPALGRGFTADEEASGGANVIVLSDAFWRTRFGAAAAAIGQTLSLDGRPHTIVGVMPPTFDPPRFFWLNAQSFWRPFGATDGNRSWGRFLLVVAKLKDSGAIETAQREMATIADDLARERPSNAGWSASVIPLESEITGQVRQPLLVLLGAVGLLLLMSVANVANLTLALVKRREHELAVRRAIGATSARLARQLMTHSAVLGTLGCAVGAVVAVLGVRGLVALLPPDVPRVGSVRLDMPVLGFMLVAAAIAALAIGLIAASRIAPAGVAMTLRETSGRSARRLRGGSLVVAEIALGLVLTVLAGLMLRTFSALRAVNLGFDGSQVVAARVGLAGPRYETPEARRAFFADALERVRAVPGVEAAGLINIRPFGRAGPATTATDASAPVVSDSVVADVRFADAAVFQTLGIPLLAGDVFDARDVADAPPRVVISQTLAQRFWPSANPVGQRLRLEMFDGITPVVIGVVGDVHLQDVRTLPRATAYLASTMLPGEEYDVIVRGRGISELLATRVRGAIAELDATVAVSELESLDGLVGRSLARDRFTTLLLGGFALMSLLLAAVGIYGVFAGDVAERRKEIGIRVALGAPIPKVVRLVLRRAMARAVAGVAIGAVVAVVAAQGMKSMLFGVAPTDPASFVGVAVLLFAVALAATLIPAIRASRVSPLIAIRTD